MREIGYYDIHSHILPGVDDGAKDLEMTKKMLERAYEQGIRFILATPHYIGGKTMTTALERRVILEQVQQTAHEIAPDLKVEMGNELYYSPSTIKDLQDQKAATLFNSDYVLVEFSVQTAYKDLYQGLRKLIETGYRPVLAHMERYSCLFKKEERVRELISLGVYLQMNTDSVMGGLFDTQASYCRSMIKEGFIHLLASDAHAIEYRAPLMEDAVKVLKKKKLPEEILERILFRNPECLIHNKYI